MYSLGMLTVAIIWLIKDTIEGRRKKSPFGTRCIYCAGDVSTYDGKLYSTGDFEDVEIGSNLLKKNGDIKLTRLYFHGRCLDAFKKYPYENSKLKNFPDNMDIHEITKKIVDKREKGIKLLNE